MEQSDPMILRFALNDFFLEMADFVLFKRTPGTYNAVRNYNLVYNDCKEN